MRAEVPMLVPAGALCSRVGFDVIAVCKAGDSDAISATCGRRWHYYSMGACLGLPEGVKTSDFGEMNDRGNEGRERKEGGSRGGVARGYV